MRVYSCFDARVLVSEDVWDSFLEQLTVFLSIENEFYVPENGRRFCLNSTFTLDLF